MGKILAYSGMMQGQEVSWMPSYGPEMRGGTANVTVILSDDRISSPYLKMFDTAIVLNQPSMDKFEQAVKPGGVLIYDPNGITDHPTRKDIRIFQIPGARLAADLGNKRVFNMIILGAFLAINPIVQMENVIKGLAKSLPQRYHHLLPQNEEAISVGLKNVLAYDVEKESTLVNA